MSKELEIGLGFIKEYKYCRSCGKTKELSKYFFNPIGDGYSTWCLDCLGIIPPKKKKSKTIAQPFSQTYFLSGQKFVTLSSGDQVILCHTNPNTKYKVGSELLMKSGETIKIIGIAQEKKKGKLQFVVLFPCGHVQLNIARQLTNRSVHKCTLPTRLCEQCGVVKSNTNEFFAKGVGICHTCYEVNKLRKKQQITQRKISAVKKKKERVRVEGNTTPIILYSGETVYMHPTINTTKYASGSTHTTDSYGDVLVLGVKKCEDKTKARRLIVRFENSGTVICVCSSGILRAIDPKVRTQLRNKESRCNVCGVVKSVNGNNFQKSSYSPTGFLTSTCKPCMRAKAQLRRKALTASQKESLRIRARQYSAIHRTSPTTAQRERNTKQTRIRRQQDPIYRLKQSMSNLFRWHLHTKHTTKPSSTMEYVGCTKQELLNYLNSGEYTMADYMKNTKGNILFHIDHIIPSKYFMEQLILDEDNTITNEEVLHRWWNYRNLRVYPAVENIIKNDTLDMELIKEYGIEDLLYPKETK